ncbi:PREDICTED: transmembrane protein 14C [Nicrophorus vespilloides]|uniref:Transmembrane protein 14C n=1 Tax=Nicrophorus vespilloides TaxID=110193 RepID=A0ABM1MIY6_NICVS|nr:PREDICTED: transmembrane protein 14C [Nicrophorus vespilloides]
MPLDITGFAYAAVVAAGGIMGYYKAGSVPSLGAGLLFGTALAYGAYQVSQDPSNYSTQLATSSILAGFMGYRFYNSGKIMPAGIVCAMSVAMIVRIAVNASGLTDRKIVR